MDEWGHVDFGGGNVGGELIDNPDLNQSQLQPNTMSSGGNGSSSTPICVNGAGVECPWKKRCEETMATVQKCMITSNNLNEEYNRLMIRLANSEKSMRLYQQKLVDALNSTDPLKKEADDLKNKLMIEMRERNRFECEAESHKASSVQLQAFVAKHEETATNLRHQMAQLQEKHSEKVADHKKIQEKATTFENKYRKAKDELKLLREENARLRKLVERKDSGFPMLQRGRRRRLSTSHHGPRLPAQLTSDEEDNFDANEELEAEMRRAENAQRSPASSPDRRLPATSMRANTTITPSRSQLRAGISRTALAILERKEREEAEGTYVGGAKKLFCGAGRRAIPATAIGQAKSDRIGKKPVGGESTSAPAQPITEESISTDATEEITAEEALSRVFAALKDVMEFPPLSPIPDLPEEPAMAESIVERSELQTTDSAVVEQAEPAELSPVMNDSMVVGQAESAEVTAAVVERAVSAEISPIITGSTVRERTEPAAVSPPEIASTVVEQVEPTEESPVVAHPTVIEQAEPAEEASPLMIDSTVTERVEPTEEASPVITDSMVVGRAESAEAVPAVVERMETAEISPIVTDSTEVWRAEPTEMSPPVIASTVVEQAEPTEMSPAIASSTVIEQAEPAEEVSPLMIDSTVTERAEPEKESPILTDAMMLDEDLPLSPHSLVIHEDIGENEDNELEAAAEISSNIPTNVSTSGEISTRNEAEKVSASVVASTIPAESPVVASVSSQIIKAAQKRQIKSFASPSVSSPMVIAAQKKQVDSSAEVETPKKRRGRPPIGKSTSSSDPSARPKTPSLGKSTSSSDSSARPKTPSLAKVQATKQEETKAICEQTSPKLFKDNRAYAAILDSMLSGVGTTHVSALQKWMTKAKSPAETVAYCFVEAIKRHNAVVWISTHLRTPIQQQELGRRLSRMNFKSPGNEFQPLSIKDKKLADLLTALLSHQDALDDWKKVPDIILTQILRQLTSATSQDMDAVLREALCRWCFYLCQNRPTKAKLNHAREILLTVVRRDDRMSTALHQQGIFHIFLTLAMVWPLAFKRIVVEPRGDIERVLRDIFRFLLANSSSKARAERLLEQYLGQYCQLGPLISSENPPNFEFMIREQLGRLSCITAEVQVTPNGICLPKDIAICVEQVLLFAPYCEERVVNRFVESALVYMSDWYAISPDDSLSRGGLNKLVADILVVSKMASFCQAAIFDRIDGILKSLKAMIFGETSGEAERPFAVGGHEHLMLIYAAIELLTSLSSGSLYGKVVQMRNLLKQLIGEMEKEKAPGEMPIQQYYRKCVFEFWNRKNK